MLVMTSHAMYDLSAAVPCLLLWLDVRYQHVLQTKVKALVFGIVREEEKRSEAQGDEGTEDEEEDELLWEPQGGSVMGEWRGTWREGRYPTSR